MRVLTENEVRQLTQRIPAGGRFEVAPDALLTPLARDFLRARGLEIVEHAPRGAKSATDAENARAGGDEALAEAVAQELSRTLAGDEPARGGPAAAENAPGAVAEADPTRRPPGTKQRAVVWGMGGDRPGILAAVAELLGKQNVNILEISQTLLSGVFAMVVIVDLSQCACPFMELKSALEELGRTLGVNLSAQRDEIFQYMHRI